MSAPPTPKDTYAVIARAQRDAAIATTKRNIADTARLYGPHAPQLDPLFKQLQRLTRDQQEDQ